MERYDGQVPGTMVDLVALPGIGRKTANVILGNAFDVPGITVDTHFSRLVTRWRWTDEKDPVKIEQAVGRLIERRDWTMLSHRVIFHGRRVCHARKPACGACPLARDCPSYGLGPTDPDRRGRPGQGRPGGRDRRIGPGGVTVVGRAYGRSVARVFSALAVVAGLAVVVACTAEHPPPSAGAGPAGASSRRRSPCRWLPARRLRVPPRPADSLLAGISLPCLTGGEDLELGRIGRPAVINLWASWCGPCRTELPELQRFADAAGDRVVLLGVVTGDTRSAATSLAADLGVTFPSVFDAQEDGQAGRRSAASAADDPVRRRGRRRPPRRRRPAADHRGPSPTSPAPHLGVSVG